MGDEWEAGDSLQRQKRCRRGWRKVKEHAAMDEATVVTFMLVSFWTAVVHEHLACLLHRSCETAVLNKRNELQTVYLTFAQTGPFASMSPMFIN